MIYELENTEKAAYLFEDFEDAGITACLQKVMGKIYVTDPEEPRSAMALIGAFAFYAGEPDAELLINKPDTYLIMVPQNCEWAQLIESLFPAFKRIRYAIKRQACFDREKLGKILASLPEGYEIRPIDSEIYDICIADPEFEDFVCVFGSKEKFFELGLGFVVMKDGKIVSGASSYSRYREGIDIEVGTIKAERHKGLAGAVCAKLILTCLDRGLTPRWDAANMMSVRLANKLGYAFDREYVCFGVE